MKRLVKLLFALTSLFLAFSSLGVKIVLAQQADLSISQRIFKHQDLNGVTTFVIAVTNNGPASATQVVVNTTLNSSWDFDDPSGQHHLSSGLLNWTGTENRSISWVIPLIRNGETAVLVFNARNNYANNPPSPSNTVQIVSLDQTDPNVTNNSATNACTVNYGVHDLSLQLTASSSNPIQGALVQFVVQVQKLSGQNGIPIRVTHDLPSGFTYISHSVSSGTYNPATGVWSLSASSSLNTSPYTLTIVATADAPGDFTHIAWIDEGGPDLIPYNNLAQVSGTIVPHNGKEADLSITTFGSRNTYSGSLGTFLVTLTNQGPDWATNIEVSDFLDLGWGIVQPFSNFVLTSGALAYDEVNRAFTWSIDSLAAGATAYFIFSADNVGNGNNPNWKNSVSVFSSEWDPNNANNFSTYTAAQVSRLTDMELTKSLFPAQPLVGQEVTFLLTATRITAEQSGQVASNVRVLDKLPTGYQYVSHSTSSGNYDPITGIWTIGHVSDGTPRTLSVTAVPLANGSYASTAVLLHDSPDPNVRNQLVSDVYAPQQVTSADLGIVGTVNDSSPGLAQVVTFTIQASNAGPDDASEVKVQASLPSGYTFVNSSTSRGTYDLYSGTWELGGLGVSEQETLQIQARVKANGDYNLGVTIEGQEADFHTGNNAVEIVVGPIIPRSDLRILKSMSPSIPDVGDPVTFTLSVENLGPDPAMDVQVVDLLPSGFAYQSSSASPGAGAYNSLDGHWEVGNLGNGASATLVISATRLASGIYSTVAQVSHEGIDPFMGNNTATTFMASGCSGSCTHTIPNGGGTIHVGPGEVYCLLAGTTFTGTFTLAAGGTICIAPGATFSPSEAPLGGVFHGVFINNGTVQFPLYNTAQYLASIENYGTWTASTIQQFKGQIQNYGHFQVNSGMELLADAEFSNYGQTQIGTLHSWAQNVFNFPYAQFVVESGVNVYQGYWKNFLYGNVYLHAGGNINFIGNIDNSGYWKFGQLNELSSTLNNYGEMEVFETANDISSTTYITNDGLLKFIDIIEVEYNGPMLTNNGTLTISHPTGGDFKMNKSVNQVFNNGMINVSGQFEQNATGSKLENNCTIICTSFFIGTGMATNRGFIHALGTGYYDSRPAGFIMEGESHLFNERTGLIRGVNFRNSGRIEGYGRFYFTGETNMQSAGFFIGSDELEPIQFFDTTPNGVLFDMPGGTVSHVVRPLSMDPEPLEDFDCTAPPTVAGDPPLTTPISLTLCEPNQLEGLEINLLEYVNPAPPVNGDAYDLILPSIMLFEYDNPLNLTNNSKALELPGKGTLHVDASGKVTFIREPGFISGSIEAEYRISNKRMGDPVTYPSPRTRISIRLIHLPVPEITIVGPEGMGTDLCLGESYHLQNALPGGEWSVSDPALASIDESGQLHPLAVGTLTVYYTITEENCSKTVSLELIIHDCEDDESKLLITNPMIRSRILKMNQP